MKKLLFIFTTFIALTNVNGQSEHEMRYDDKIRIREAINIANEFGEKIWKEINDVPFVLILVTDSVEFLINHPYPSDDFTLSGTDSILKTEIYYRAKQFNKHFLATFPAVNGVNCIVVGTPENTVKHSTDWTITLLHEHFHQYQYSYPDYFTGVNNLGLSGGDQTGMWQLNYPFPYDNSIITEQYKKYSSALSKTLAVIETDEFEEYFTKYISERNKLKQLLKPADYSYFSFQIWQEGIARYTEYKFLELLSNHKPSEELSQLSDFVAFDKYKDDFYKSKISLLNQQSIENDKRICFYEIGFAEGLLLDKLNPEWRDNYLTDKFYIENYSSKFR
ncbi:MAG: hypothetical protein IPM38_19460 [Ignavibacteria bacterium]|nr:hypothetical protein [Ignavibacteria bacterium]